MQTYNLFQIQNKQNFKLFSENFFGFSYYPCWDHNSRSYDHLLRLKAVANLQPFFLSFQNKFQIFFRERFASITRYYWAYNAAVKLLLFLKAGANIRLFLNPARAESNFFKLFLSFHFKELKM